MENLQNDIELHTSQWHMILRWTNIVFAVLSWCSNSQMKYVYSVSLLEWNIYCAWFVWFVCSRFAMINKKCWSSKHYSNVNNTIQQINNQNYGLFCLWMRVANVFLIIYFVLDFVFIYQGHAFLQMVRKPRKSDCCLLPTPFSHLSVQKKMYEKGWPSIPSLLRALGFS